MTGGDENTQLEDVPANAVRTTIKMDGDYSNFRLNNGQATFITNLARSLNVDYS